MWQALKVKYWVLHTNVNTSSQNKKHFRGLLVHLLMYSQSCQVLMPNDKETIWGLFKYFIRQTKTYYSYFWKDSVMKNNYWKNLAKQDSLRYTGQFERHFWRIDLYNMEKCFSWQDACNIFVEIYFRLKGCFIDTCY